MPPISMADLPPKYQKQVMEKLQAQAATKGKPLAAADPDNKPEKKQSKYRNKKVQINGIWFDSTKEGNRYRELMYALEKGYIKDLRLQHEYTLQPATMMPNGHKIRAIRYNADFVYRVAALPPAWDTTGNDYEFWSSCYPGQTVIEDTKGLKTDVYKMKYKMMAEQGHEIREL